MNAYQALAFNHTHIKNDNPEYLNLTYHKYTCECGESITEKHDWVSNRPGDLSANLIEPLYIPMYTYSICNAVTMGPLPLDFL